MPLLLLGQFGLVGLLGLMAALGCAFYGQLRRAVHDEDVPARLYVVLLLLLTADALLNSFLFYPALLLTGRSEEHTSELQSLMRTSYAVFCFKKKHTIQIHNHNKEHQTDTTA